MAILQVRDIDDSLYDALKTLAKKERRSISQEVIMMIESYISQPKTSAAEATEEFLNLSWKGDESADEIINDLKTQHARTEMVWNFFLFLPKTFIIKLFPQSLHACRHRPQASCPLFYQKQLK